MNAKLLAKSKVLEDLLSEMDESILSKIKKGDVDADVKVIKMEAMPKGKESMIESLREEEPMGEMEDEDEEMEDMDFSGIKKYASSEMMDEEEEDPEFAELKELKKKYRG